MATAVCLELPLNVKNLDKAIEAVGGPLSISEASSSAALAKDSEGLQLKLRNDRFHHPVNSAAVASKNIVVEIELPEFCFTIPEQGEPSPTTRQENDIKQALTVASLTRSQISVKPKFKVQLIHRFREIADFQYYTGNSLFITKMSRSVFAGDLTEIQKLRLNDPQLRITEDLLPPPRFTVSTQPFYYGYKQSPYVKLVDDGSGQPRLLHKSASSKVISNVLNWEDPVPSEPPADLEDDPRANIKQCLEELKLLFEKRPSYTRRSLQHKLGSHMTRYLKYALPYVSYYYRSGPWRGAYIKYGCDPSKQPEMAKYQVEHFRIVTDDALSTNKHTVKTEERIEPSKKDYVFDGTVFPDVPLLQLCDIADGFLENCINTNDLRVEVDMNDGWYTENTISMIRKVLRAELVAAKEGKKPLTELEKRDLIKTT